MKPLFSIVTICYQAVNQIEGTIQSVLSQSCHDYEYIIIDGASTDGTLDILSKYKKDFSHFISEKDKGIYSAMNKGLNLASGEFTLFMNAGDRFYYSDVLEQVKEEICHNPNRVAYYGDVVYSSILGERYIKAFELKRVFKGMFCSHQSIFINTVTMKKLKFDEKYKLAADYGLILNTYIQNNTFCDLNMPVAIVTVQEGATYSNFKKSLREVKEIKIAAGLNKIKSIRDYYWGYSIFCIHELIKRYIPNSIKKKILRIH